MKYCILGAKGLLGGYLAGLLGGAARAFDHAELDVTNFALLKTAMRDLHPDVIINCVAWNDVDGAEEEETREKSGEVNGAKLLNCTLVRELAHLSNELGSTLVTYSTDHVFDGAEPQGYRESDTPHPINAYGRSKWCGEQALTGGASRYYLIRTSRLYGRKPESQNAKLNFVLRMMELGRGASELSVVDEEPACFTYALDLANATLDLVRSPAPYGTYHLVNEGAATWCECAKEIFAFLRLPVEIKPAKRTEHPRHAPVPQYSILLNTKSAKLRNWKDALHVFLTEVQPL